MQAGAMVAGGPAPARVRQCTSQAVECVAAVGGWINRIAPWTATTALRPQGIGDLVTFVAKIKNMAIAVGGNPGAIIDKLGGGNQRTGGLQRDTGTNVSSATLVSTK